MIITELKHSSLMSFSSKISCVLIQILIGIMILERDIEAQQSTQIALASSGMPLHTAILESMKLTSTRVVINLIDTGTFQLCNAYLVESTSVEEILIRGKFNLGSRPSITCSSSFYNFIHITTSIRIIFLRIRFTITPPFVPVGPLFDARSVFKPLIRLSDSSFIFSKSYSLSQSIVFFDYSGDLDLINVIFSNIRMRSPIVNILGKNGAFIAQNTTVSDVELSLSKSNIGLFVSFSNIVKLTDFEVIDSRYEGTGPAGFVVINQVEAAIIKGFVFKNCRSDSSSGLMLLFSKTSIYQSEFVNNSAVLRGAAIRSVSGFVELRDSFFKNNCISDTDGSRGGAINIGISSMFIIENVTFLNNFARRGGSIFQYTNSELKIQNSRFSFDSSFYGGSNIFVSEAKLAVAFTNFSHTSCLGNKCQGGNIACVSSECTVEKSLFKNSSAGTGGALYIQSESNFAIEDSSFDSMFSNLDGGAIAIVDSKFSLFNSEAIDSESSCNGGLIFALNSEISLIGLRVRNSNIRKMPICGHGGAVHCENCKDLMVEFSSFFQTSAVYGGAISIQNIEASRLSISSSLFRNNFATHAGGAIFSSSGINIVGVSIHNASAENGGAILFNGKVHDDVYEVIDSSIKEAHAQSDGGAIYTSSIAYLVISDCNFSKNSAEMFGGALYISPRTDFRIRRSLFDVNSASSGGAIYVNESDNFQIEATNFSSNYAIRSNADVLTGMGGAISLNVVLGLFSSSVFSRNNFRLNRADLFGGGIAYLQIDRLDISLISLMSNSLNLFKDNIAKWGPDFGTLPARISMSSNMSNIVITDPAFATIRLFDFFDNVITSPFVGVAKFYVKRGSNLDEIQMSDPVDNFQFAVDPTSQSFDRSLRFSKSSASSQTSIVYGFGFYELGLEVGGNNLMETSSTGSNLPTLKFKVSFCSPGYRRTFKLTETCERCEAGKISKEYSDRAIRCISCSPGRYNLGSSENCDECLPGRFADGDGKQECSNCPLGRIASDTGSSYCSDCSIGKFMESTGSARCRDCPLNAVTLLPGTSSQLDCFCPEGLYGSAFMGKPCMSCDHSAGFECPPNSSFPIVLEGFWRLSWRDIPFAHKCFPSDACSRFISSPKGSNCREGYDGVRCGKCVDGYYRGDSSCQPCLSNTYRAWFFTSIPILIFSNAVLRMSKFSQGRSDSSLRVIIRWLQILGVLPRNSNGKSKTPAWYDSVFFLGKLANLNVDTISISCSTGLTFWGVYFLQVLFPFIIALLVLCVRLTIQRLFKSQETISNSNSMRWVSVNSRGVFQLLMRIGTYILISLYTYCLSVAFRPFRCFKQEDGSYTMVDNPSSDCFTAEWFKYAPFTIGYSLALTVCFPIFISYKLWRFRNNLSDENLFRIYGFLITPFSQKLYWWELVLVLKRVIFLVFSDLTSGMNTYLVHFYLLLIMLCATITESILLPFASHRTNSINILFGEFVLFMLFFDFYVHNHVSDDETARFIFQILLTLLFWSFLIYVTCINFYSVFRSVLRFISQYRKKSKDVSQDKLRI